ncbi:MAG: hypothetical protein HRT74_09680, partial [Flavobacteriales bacterium]|nr:hypothetical protein [Flavobacteriales bacterium]
MGQVFGHPKIENYTKRDYQGGTEVYEIGQLPDGSIVCANNNGLLVKRSNDWNCLPQPNNTILRSIEVAGDSVFVGGQSELGYFKRVEHEWLYTSLVGLLPEGFGFEDVWEIDLIGDELFFRTSKNVLWLHQGVLEVLVNSESTLTHSWTTGDTIYVATNEKVLTVCSGGEVTEHSILGAPSYMIPYEGKEIWIYEHGDLVTSEAKNLELNIASLLRNKSVLEVVSYEDGYVFCTREHGLIITDKRLDYQVIYDISHGLRRNHINNVFIDDNGDLWVGTNNGLSYIQESSPFRFFQVDGDLKGPGHSFAWFNGERYFGTSNGLYKTSSTIFEPQFSSVKGAEGQVWNLHEINDELFICHHRGVLIYDGQRISSIEGLEGGWIVLPVEGNDNVLMVGHYNGISLIQKENEKWSLMDVPSPVQESCRIGSIDEDGFYWFSHPYRGAWRIELDTSSWTMEVANFFNEEDEFPSSYHINVSNINDQMIFTAETGLFTFDSNDLKITSLDSVFSNHDLNRRFLKVFDGEGDDFFLLNQKSLEYFSVRDKALSKDWKVYVLDGIKDRFNAGFEFMLPFDDQHYLLGCDEGFALMNTKMLGHYAKEEPRLDVEMNSQADDADELVIRCSNTDELATQMVSPKFARVQFSYSSNSFHMLDRLHIATKMIGVEDDWVLDEGIMSREFSSLEPGHYEFHVKAMNSAGEIISSVVLPFDLEPHWYSSNWAKCAWIFIGLIAIALLVLLPQNRFAKERQQIKVESAKEINLQKHEAEVIMDKMRADQLNSELQYKNKELASVTMHIVQKGEILQKIMKTLKTIDVDNTDKAKKEVRKLVKLISSDVRLDNHWEQFERCFDSVHVNFLQRLRESYPVLPPNDHKLCAYLRMN